MKKITLVLIIAFAAPSPAWAAPPAPAPAAKDPLQAYVSEAEHMQWIGDYALAQEARLGTGCATPKLTNLRKVVLEAPVFEAGQFHPVSGSWIEIIGIDRCGRSTSQNLLMTARSGAQPAVKAMVPGSSITDFRLQLDLYLPISAMAAATDAKCEEPTKIIDTRLLAPLKPDQAVRLPWVEVWTGGVCGKRVEVDVTLTPTPDDGTHWAAELHK